MTSAPERVRLDGWPHRSGDGAYASAAAVIRACLVGLHLFSVVAFASLVLLARDEPFAWRWWSTVVLLVGCAAALGRHLLDRPRAAPDAAPPDQPTRDSARAAREGAVAPYVGYAPYVAYALAWLLAYWAHPSPAGWQALIDHTLFLAAIVLAAHVPDASWLLALLTSAFGLIGLQVFGPVSVVVGTGRATHYKSLDQWGGYPEIGMLVGLGASACLALMFATRRAPLAVAAAILALGLTATTIYMMSRSAILTIALVAGWLAIVAAIRWRTRLAIAAVTAAAIGGLAVAIIGGSAVWDRVTGALLVRGGEMQVRGEGWRVAIAMLGDAPWLGIGPGRYPQVYGTYSSVADPAHAYNMPLHIGAELGLVGLAAWLWFWARPLAVTWRASARTRAGGVAFASHAMLLAFLLRSQSEHFLANLPTSFRMLMVLGLLFGLAEAAVRSRPRQNSLDYSARRAPRLRSPTVPLG